MEPAGFGNLREAEPVARRRLDPVHYDYFAGGAQDEVTVRANEEAFERLTLVPRILRGAGEPSLEVTLLGETVRMPIGSHTRTASAPPPTRQRRRAHR